MDYELYHHGVLGQKWGIRRYQPYPDGHVGGKEVGEAARAGHRRKKKSEPKLEPSTEEKQEAVKKYNLDKAYQKTLGSTAAEKLENTKKGLNASKDLVNMARQMNEKSMKSQTYRERMDLSHMTNKELQDRITRENLELQYNRLFGEEKSTVTKGQRYLGDVLDVAGDVLAIGVSAVTLALLIKGKTG